MATVSVQLNEVNAHVVDNHVIMIVPLEQDLLSAQLGNLVNLSKVPAEMYERLKHFVHIHVDWLFRNAHHQGATHGVIVCEAPYQDAKYVHLQHENGYAPQTVQLQSTMYPGLCTAVLHASQNDSSTYTVGVLATVWQ